MGEDHEIATRKVTPEFVLAVFQDCQRREFGFDDCDPDLKITFDTTVDDWFFDRDIYWAGALGKSLNHFWKINVPLPEWKAVLKPAKQRTLRGICELVAVHATVPVVQEKIIFGMPCKKAGVFLAIRKLLEEAGCDVREVAPSTPLAEYTRRFTHVFCGQLTLLAPGALPQVKCIADHGWPAYILTSIISSICSFLLLMEGIQSNSHSMALIGGIALFASIVTCAILCLVPPQRDPVSVTLGELRTFKDLAIAIAAKCDSI